VSRRAPLPGASELFRLTSTSSPVLDLITPEQPVSHREPRESRLASVRKEESPAEPAPAKRGTGRTKHDAKITVYVSGDELLALERARLDLRGYHDLIVDRGRLVREAVSMMLADFEQNGENSTIVRRLRAGGVDGQESDD
jgi:hypothetical protein